jgi:hypothetical protein
LGNNKLRGNWACEELRIPILIITSRSCGDESHIGDDIIISTIGIHATRNIDTSYNRVHIGEYP